MDAFRENLDDLERQVSDIAADVQQLERCTTDAISFEELMGHCVELYQNNRQGALALVAHLERYGYQQPAGVQPEPEDPCSSAQGGGPGSVVAAEDFCFADGEQWAA